MIVFYMSNPECTSPIRISLWCVWPRSTVTALHVTHKHRCAMCQILAECWDVTCQLPLCRARRTFTALGRPSISTWKGELGDFPESCLASICIVNGLIFTYTVYFRSIKWERLYRSCNSFYLAGKCELFISKSY